MDYAGRREEFCRQMAEQELDAYLVLARPNVRYLSGFTGEDTTLLVTANRTVLVTDSRYTEQAAEETDVEEIFSRQGPMCAALANQCKNLLNRNH